MDGSPRIDPYLSGNFAPVRSEDDFELAVVGEIPAGLNGAFYRNGPNPRFDPIDDYHWFSGDGMIHGFFAMSGVLDAGGRALAEAAQFLREISGETKEDEDGGR